MNEEKIENKRSLVPIVKGSLARTGQLIDLTKNIISISRHRIRARIIPYVSFSKKYQIYDFPNKLLMEQEFDKAYFLDPSLTFSKSCIIERNGLKSIVTETSDLLNPKWYDDIELIESQVVFNFSIVRSNGLLGVINDLSETILPCIYNEIETINTSGKTLLKYSKDNVWGLFNIESRKEILPIVFDSIKHQAYDAFDNILILSKKNEIEFIKTDNMTTHFLDNNVQVLAYNEGVCTVKIDEKWAMFNLDLKEYINDEYYSYAGVMKNGFCLCKKGHNSVIVKKNGTEILIGEEGDNYHRSGNILYKSVETDKKMHFTIYLIDKFISNFSIDWDYYGMLSFKAINDDLIEIASHSMKYFFNSHVAVYNLHGDKIEDRPSYSCYKPKSHPGESSKVCIEETNWKVDQQSLYFKNKLIYKPSEPIEELKIDGFYSGIAFVKEVVDIDAEFGITSLPVGFIDIEGNKYWE